MEKAELLPFYFNSRSYFIHISNRFTQRVDQAGQKIQENTLGRVQKNSQAKLAVAGSVLAGSRTLAKQAIKTKSRQVAATAYQSSSKAISDSLAHSKARRAESLETNTVTFKEEKANQAHRSEQVSSAVLNVKKGLKNAEHGIYYAKSISTRR